MRKLLPTMMILLGVAFTVIAGILCDSLDAGTRLGNVQCLSLNGSGYASHADTDELDMGVGDFIQEIWLKTTSSEEDGLVTKRPGAGSGYMLGINNGKALIKISDGTLLTITGNTALNDGSWHHLMFAADRDGNGTVYLDGAVDTTVDISARSGDLSNTDDLQVGTCTSLYYNGLLSFGQQWYLGYSGLPTASGATPADYAAWRYNNPYAPLSAFANGAWAGYADADRSELVTNNTFDSDYTGWSSSFSTSEIVSGRFHGVATTYQKIDQVGILQADKAYEIFYNMEVISGTMNVSWGSDTIIRSIGVSGATDYRDVFTTNSAGIGNGRIAVRNTSETAEFYLDNVYIKRVGNILKCDLDGDYTDETSNSLDLTAGGSGNEFIYSTVRGIRLEAGTGKTILK